MFGKDWKKVEEYVRTRTGSQIRSHAQKVFAKEENQQNQNDYNSISQENNEQSKPISNAIPIKSINLSTPKINPLILPADDNEKINSPLNKENSDLKKTQNFPFLTEFMYFSTYVIIFKIIGKISKL